MIRRLCVLLLFVFAADTASYAQTTTPQKKGSKQDTRKAAEKKPMITVDTAIVQQPIIVPPLPVDTPTQDTTKIEQVADVIHDSVKAQIKSPIVQVPVTLKRLIIPGVLFAYGAITLNNGGLRGINEQARDWIWDGNVHGRPYMEDYMLLVPAAAVYALNIAGIKGQNNLIDRSVIYGMSNLIANGFVFGLKKVGIETRPDGSDNHSFPSGHTAEAFVSAEFLHQEYKDGRAPWPVVAAGYGVAISVAYLRMAHNKHWLGDVVAGAGVGMASTRFAYYLYPIIKHKLFGSKKVREDALILPTFQNGVYGVAMMYRF